MSKAIEELKLLRRRLSNPEDCERGVYSFSDGDYVEALDLAIKALEEQDKAKIDTEHSVLLC